MRLEGLGLAVPGCAAVTGCQPGGYHDVYALERPLTYITFPIDYGEYVKFVDCDKASMVASMDAAVAEGALCEEMWVYACYAGDTLELYTKIAGFKTMHKYKLCFDDDKAPEPTDFYLAKKRLYLGIYTPLDDFYPVEETMEEPAAKRASISESHL